MLRLVDQIILLLLQDDGRFIDAPKWNLECTIAGAVLMDLALEDRVDTDLEALHVANAQPTGDDLLDGALAAIAEDERRDALYWVRRTTRDVPEIRAGALNRLVEQGILVQREIRYLGIRRSRVFPLADSDEARQVSQHVRDVLSAEDIPHPRDVMLVDLAQSSGVLAHLLTRRQRRREGERIRLFQRMDLISQAVFAAIAAGPDPSADAS